MDKYSGSNNHRSYVPIYRVMQQSYCVYVTSKYSGSDNHHSYVPIYRVMQQ